MMWAKSKVVSPQPSPKPAPASKPKPEEPPLEKKVADEIEHRVNRLITFTAVVYLVARYQVAFEGNLQAYALHLARRRERSRSIARHAEDFKVCTDCLS